MARVTRIHAAAAAATTTTQHAHSIAKQSQDPLVTSNAPYTLLQCFARPSWEETHHPKLHWPTGRFAQDGRRLRAAAALLVGTRTQHHGGNTQASPTDIIWASIVCGTSLYMSGGPLPIGFIPTPSTCRCIPSPYYYTHAARATLTKHV